MGYGLSTHPGLFHFNTLPNKAHVEVGGAKSESELAKLAKSESMWPSATLLGKLHHLTASEAASAQTFPRQLCCQHPDAVTDV